MEKRHILVVDDDSQYLEMVKTSLEIEGCQVTSAGNGISALKMIQTQQFDLAIIDVMMPRIDGMTLTRNIRAFSQIPIILVTGKKTAAEDMVKGLEIGADDYLTKPYKIPLLKAKISAILRRVNRGEDKYEQASTLTVGPIEIDYNKAEVTVNGQPAMLSSTEYRLLIMLAQNLGQVITYQHLLESVWGREYLQDRKILWVTVARLRQKLGVDKKNSPYVVTKSGIGYLLTPEPDTEA